MVAPNSCPLRARCFAHLVEQLGRKRARTDARGVGLGNAKDVVELARTAAAAGSAEPGGGIRRRHERIGAVVDVEQGALGAFVEYARAPPVKLVKGFGDVRRSGAR